MSNGLMARAQCSQQLRSYPSGILRPSFPRKIVEADTFSRLVLLLWVSSFLTAIWGLGFNGGSSEASGIINKVVVQAHAEQQTFSTGRL